MAWGPQDLSGLERLDGGITAVSGISAGGVAAGLKQSGRPDLALVATPESATCAVMTTTNLVKAAPCVLTERHASNGEAQALIVNSGNANACTPDGMRHAEQMASATAEQLRVAPSSVLVLSTGVIGVPMPMDRILAGIPKVVDDLSEDGGHRAATAICTTDTVTKEVAFEVSDDAGSCIVAGMAKGAGMIEPAMATLIVVLATDAPLTATVLRQLLRRAVGETFNRISIDAAGSTNDAVIALSTGAAEQPPGLASFTLGLRAVCADLARQVVADGEGTERIAEITVTSAPTEEVAARLARAVARSTLFRSALHGADPNWGRILAAMGGAGVAFEPDRVSVSCGGITVCRFGVAAAFDRGQAAAAMSKPEVEIVIDLGLGRDSATFLTADITPEYVHFNSAYTT